MSNHTIIKLRRGTAAEWAIVNEVLKLGEPGFEKDTFKLKIGDGITPWNDLPYIVGGFGGNDGPLEYTYDVNMGSDDIITPSNLYFSSLTNSIDYSNFYNYIIDKQYGVSLKLTSKNNSNKFIVLSSDSISKNHNTGIINAFWPSSSIQWIIDGGDDQYDSANFINNSITSPTIPTDSPGSSTLRRTSIPYNGGRIVENSQYWGNNSYVTLYKKSIFSMVAYGNSATMPTSVYYAGNVGADGDGDKDIGSLANYNGYQAGYCRIWGDDPTFTKLIITKVGSTTPVYATDDTNDTNDDLFVASGLNSDTIAMVVFYGSDDTNPSNISDIQTLFESFVDNILVPSASINDIYTNFYSSINNVYDSVDSSFWYNNFEFFTGTNNGNPNYILAEGGSGSGLEFSVTVNQDTNEYVFSIDSAGINYQNGDIIVLRGDSLNSPNGRSPDEDIYLVITSIDVGGEVLAWDTITDFIYSFSIDSILSRSDGFRFVDNEIYYLNIDIIGGGAGSNVDNYANNRVLTSDGTTTGIDGESNLTFDGSLLTVTGDMVANTGTLDVLAFDTNIGPDLLKGQIGWNDTEGTVDVGLTDTATISIGEHNLFRIRNETGGPLYKGQAVYANNVHSNGIITPALYVADGSIAEIRFMGLLLEDVNHNNNGYVINFGHIFNIDTRGNVASNIAVGDETWADGDILYVHPTVAGKLTKVEPKNSISVAIILDAANNGKIFVRPTSYGDLNQLHDVAVSGATNGQFLQYNSSTDYWVPTSYGSFTQLYPKVISNGTVSGSVATNVADGQIFDMTVSGSTTLSNPTNAVDGVTVRWRITQDGTGGHSVSLDSAFQIPSSASSPLPWSTTPNATDILAATYHAGRSKWDVVAFVPGY